MDVERLLRKLEPLIPDRVARWQRARDMVDHDLRALLDKEILGTGYRLLGDFRGRMLLSLPPKRTAKGTYDLGTVLYEKDKWPCGISDRELMQNLAIFGRSGAGKTNVVFHLLQQLSKHRVPFLFLDWKRTARHLIPLLDGKINVFTPGRSLAPFPFNPFIPPPKMETNAYMTLLIDVLAEAFTLGDGARTILQRALSALYVSDKPWPNVTDVLHAVSNLPAKNREHGWQVSAVRAIESLRFMGMTAQESQSQQDLIQTLLQENTIIELDSLGQGAKKFLVPLICLWIYHARIAAADRELLRLVVVLEEAHHVLYRQEHRSKESLMNMLLRQCRELGIGIIVVDQHPHLISSAALGNVYTSICLNQKDPSDINRAAGLSVLDDQDKHWLSMLPVGEGIVKMQDRWRKPFLVRFPLVPIRKGAVTDEVLKWLQLSISTGSSRKRVFGKEFERVRRIRAEDSRLDDDSFRLIEDIIEHKWDGVKARYQRLGWSAGKGNTIKARLVSQGILDSLQVPVGRSRKVVLGLTNHGRRVLGMNNANGHHRESLAHAYWKQFYADLYRRKGYRVRIEAPRLHGIGRVDVLADKDGRTIAIEIETGKSDVVSNIRQDLLEKYDQVLIVATNESAEELVTKRLGRIGLIIRNRVSILLKAVYCVTERPHD